MKVTAEWKGADEFVDGLRAVVRRQPEFIKEEALTAARTVAGDFEPKIPVLTGRAKRSVTVRQVDDTAQLSAGVGIAYWEFLDFGGTTGKGHKPRRGGGSVKRKNVGKQGRFFWRSLDERYEDIIAAAGKRLAALMRRARLVVTEHHGNTQRRGS